MTYEDADQLEQAISPMAESVPEVAKKTRAYTVRKADTLQKISLQFYGTTKKWPLLYQANQDKLKGPDKIKPGQVLVIPEAGAARK